MVDRLALQASEVYGDRQRILLYLVEVQPERMDDAQAAIACLYQPDGAVDNRTFWKTTSGPDDGEESIRFEVEFVAASGRAQALLTLGADDLRPVSDDDQIAVRPRRLPG